MPMTLSRALLTVLIPGLIAVTAWLLALVQYTPATLGFNSYPTLANALVFAFAAVAGTACEGWGTFIEARWDKEREEAYAVKENWYAYLSRNSGKEPVGYRYLSRLVTALYFELSMLFAVPSFITGGCILASLRFPQYRWAIALVSLIALVASAVYFWWQARSTHCVLCKTRLELNARTAAS